MTPFQADALAARVLRELEPDALAFYGRPDNERLAADRQRIVSDRAGLQEHSVGSWEQPESGAECSACSYDARRVPWPCADALRYGAGLRRTAALYGVAT